jgi:hypothetical protein
MTREQLDREVKECQHEFVTLNASCQIKIKEILRPSKNKRATRPQRCFSCVPYNCNGMEIGIHLPLAIGRGRDSGGGRI